MLIADINQKKEVLKFPWEHRPAEIHSTVWRYSDNPIIKEDHLDISAGISNSAVVAFEKGFAGIFRVADKRQNLNLHVGFSDDGIKWDIASKPIQFICDLPEMMMGETNYDPRITKIDGRFHITWCAVDRSGAPTIAVGYTDDFQKFYRSENAFLPCNRNGVLFPRKIGGKYAMLSRPSDMGHTPFGNIYYSQSPDLRYWGDHRFVMGTSQPWESLKIGPGPVPIETPDGWLVLYHGVQESCGGYLYSMGAVLLDIEKPWQVLKRVKSFILNPQAEYERVGIVPNVVFPCAILNDEKTGKLAIYYGAADTSVCLAFARLDELLEFVKNHS